MSTPTEAHLDLALQIADAFSRSGNVAAARLIADSEARAVAAAVTALTCTHHNDQQRAACPVCLVAAITAESVQLRDQLAAARQRETVALASWDEERGRALREGARVVELKARAELAETELKLLREWQRDVIQNANAHHAERKDAIARAESAEREAFDWKKIARYEAARAERAEAELAIERARLRQLALDACRAAAIVPVVWYPTGYYVNPNDLGKINKQQVDACVAAIDAAMKEGAK